MSAPIPSAYATGFASGYTMFYCVRLDPPGGTPMYFVSYWPAIATLEYNSALVDDAQIFPQYLAAEVNGSTVQGIGEIDFNFQMNDIGGLAGRNEATVRLLNQEFISDTFLLYDIDNAPIEIWQGYMPNFGIPGIDLNNECLLLFKGVVYEWDSWTHDIVNLKCYDDRHLTDIKIPVKIVEAATYPNAPEASIGKAIPILFGDFQTDNTNAYGNRTAPEVGISNLAPTVLVDQKLAIFYVSSEPWDHPASDVYYVDPSQPYQAVLAPGSIEDKVGGATGALTDLSFAVTFGIYYVRRVTGSFLYDGFKVGDTITIATTSGTNDGDYTVVTVSDRLITVVEAVIAESAATAGESSVTVAGGNSDGVGYITTAPDNAAVVYVYPLQVSSRNLAPEPWLVTDEDPTDFISLTNTTRLALQIGDFTPPGSLIGDAIGVGIADYFFHCELANVTSGGTTDVHLVIRNLSSGIEDTYATPLANGDNDIPLDLVTGDTWDSLKNYEWRIEPEATGSCDVYHVWIETRSRVDLFRIRTIVEPVGGSYSQVFADLFSKRGIRFNVRKESTVESGKTNIFFSCKGALYGSWIDSGGRSVGFAEGDVIEQPAYVIEYILRELMGVASADIDTDSFDEIGNSTDGTRKDWIFRASLTSQAMASEYLRQICREFGCILYQDPNDSTGYLRWRLVSLPTTASGADFAITENLIHVDEGTQFPSLFLAQMTPQAAVINDLYVNYRKNYTNDKHARSIYVSDVDHDAELENNLSSDTGAPRDTTYSAWMAESQTKYNLVIPSVINLDFIGDDATAERHLKLVSDWFTFKRVRITLNLIRTLDTLSLRIGDVCTINSTLLGVNHSGISKFMVTRLNYPGVDWKCPPYITVEFEEVPSQITGARVASQMFDSHSIISSVIP